MGDLEGKVKDCVSKSDVNNGVYGAHHITTNCSSKESSSGFMLLSVKHLSKVKKGKPSSANGTEYDFSTKKQAGMRTALPLPSFSEVGGDLMLPSSSYDAARDVYASGSIEAEEFEDFEDPEDDTDLADDENLINHISNAHKCCNTLPYSVLPLHSPIGSQSSAKSLNGHSQPQDSLDDVSSKRSSFAFHDGYRQQHSNRLLSPILISSFDQFVKLNYLQPFQSKCIYPAYPSDPHHPGSLSSADSDIIYSSRSPIPYDKYSISFGQNYQNNCHLTDQRIITDSQDFPIVSDVSQLSNSVCTMANHNYPDLPNTSDWMKFSSVLNPPYNIGLSPRSRHGSYTQTPVTCLHHLHPSTTDDTTSTASAKSHLTSDVVAMTTASLPPLQPASRFRKARIHETVEQWSCGRVSAHDCHLKAIPDWVSELQKKSFVCEEADATLANKKIKCLSCFIPKNEDTNATLLSRFAKGFAHLGISFDPCSINNHQELEDRPNILSHGSSGSNLFSFWNDGLRVCYQIPFSRIHMRHSEPSHDTCDSCESTIQENVESEYKEKSASPLSGHNGHDLNALSSLSKNGTNEGNTGITGDSTILLNATDPATAYLRRQHMGTEIDGDKLSVVADLEQHSDNSIIASTAEQPLKKVTAHQSDLTNADSKTPNHCFDESSRSPIQKVCFCRFSSTPSSNIPPIDPNTDFIAKKTNRIPLELQISSEISKSKLRLLNLIPSDEDKVGSGQTKTDPFISSVQDFMSKDPSLMSKHELCDKFPITHISTGGFTEPISPKNVRSRFRPGNRRSKSFDDGFCASRLDRMKNRLCNSDIVKRACAPLTVDDLTSATSSKALKFPTGFASEVEYCQNPRTSSLLSDRLEARIRASMEAIRSTLVNSFRDELANVLSENVSLRSEITRLNSELTLLRSYKHAFFAIRPFISPGLWENICIQHGLPVSSLMNDSDCQSSCDA
ncbi:unnamed protein product [Heterobilharzia americana]|nr:unnamed protein product [Heterobilharzia americana]CAH8447936.1 unnamed protein product [Heterobilharzia americana]